MVNNAHPVTWKPHAKFQPDWSFNSLMAVKTTSDGYGRDKTTPLPHLHEVNNAYPGTWNHITNLAGLVQKFAFGSQNNFEGCGHDQTTPI